ncbi:MAG: hypothetical protein KC621_29200, partial [Myxococcales bacterium]|nr:hypothetical protein [Myxococcales bacterium]
MRPAAWIGPGLLALAPTAAAAQGLTTTFFDGASCAPLPDAVRASRLQSTLELADATAWDLPPGTLVPYTIRMSGMFRADTDGPHTFQLEADDTVVVTIDGSEIYSVPGPRGVTTTTFGVALSAGDHVLAICHVEEGGPRTFNLRLQAPGSASFVPIASRQLVYDPPFGPGSTTIGFDTLAAGTYLTTELVAS